VMAGIAGFARRNRAALFLGLLLVVGAVIAQVAAENNPPPGGPPLSSRDAGPGGTLALALWLQRLGYRVERAEGRQSSPGDGTGTLFVLEPSQRFQQVEARLTADWVRRGGTLVYAPSLLPVVTATGVSLDDGLGSELGIGPRFGRGPAGPTATPATPALPFFVAPPASRFVVDDALALDFRDDAWVPLVHRGSGSSADVVVATRALGRGRVVAAASPAFFANRGIGEGDNSALVLNVLARAPAATVVTFDEYHHGAVAGPDLLSAIRASPWGWALIYAALATFVFALWGGRRFGPAVVVPKGPGRSAGDYVGAVAGLLQRQPAGPTRAIDWAQKNYAGHVRRELARAYTVSADLPAPELARLLAERRPVDPDDLTATLAALDRPGLGERGLLLRMRTLEPMLRTLLNRRG
jgi:Domain of unknown function (DUF4350)